GERDEASVLECGQAAVAPNPDASSRVFQNVTQLPGGNALGCSKELERPVVEHRDDAAVGARPEAPAAIDVQKSKQVPAQLWGRIKDRVVRRGRAAAHEASPV